MPIAHLHQIGGQLMEFNQKELEYLLTCLNFHYSESDYKEQIIDINSQIAIKIDEQLQLHRRATHESNISNS